MTLEIYAGTDDHARRDALTRLQSLVGETQDQSPWLQIGLLPARPRTWNRESGPVTWRAWQDSNLPPAA